jgi:hypothetical protein
MAPSGQQNPKQNEKRLSQSTQRKTLKLGENLKRLCISWRSLRLGEKTFCLFMAFD